MSWVERAIRSRHPHSGRRLTAVVSVLVTALGVSAAQAASAEPADRSVAEDRPGPILTEEDDCFETGDRRPVLLSDAQSYVPERYVVTSLAAPPPPAWLGAATAHVANAGFIDYVCESLSVNGHAPRPTMVSIGTVLVRRDGVSTDYVLWVATDNPLYFARLRQLGVDAHFIPKSSYSETTNENGQRRITVHYVENRPGGLDHTRTITVVATPSGLPTPSIGGPIYHLGSKGEVAIAWSNLTQSGGRASVCLDVAPESLPTVYGITSYCFPNPRTFTVGSWTGTIELLSPPTPG